MPNTPAGRHVLYRLEGKIDHLEKGMGEIRELIAGKFASIEQIVHQHKNMINVLQADVKSAKESVAGLEATRSQFLEPILKDISTLQRVVIGEGGLVEWKQQAHGAALVVRAAWVVGIAIASIAGGAAVHALFH